MKVLYLIFTLALSYSLLSCNNKKHAISVEWTRSIKDDYSFAEKWNYQETLHRNDYGQLICDGLCSDEVYNMLDENRKIPSDSISKYYRLVDTTHYYHTLEHASNKWESGLGYIDIIKTNNDTIICKTGYGVSNYSTLIIKITGDECIPTVEFRSPVAKVGLQIYNCNGGNIIIDSKLWKEGIVKAKFNFTFSNQMNQEAAIWEGKILNSIK